MTAKETARHGGNPAGREDGSPGGRTEHKPATGRPAFQGNAANARNPSQRAPRWTPPKGSAALAELQRLFATPAQSESVSVVAIRDDGRRVLYGHYDDRIAAEATVTALARVGLHAEVVVGIDSTTRPGTTIRPAR